MKKTSRNLYLGLLIICICLPRLLWIVFGKYVDSANYENRTLADRPVFDIDTYEDYPAAYEAFFNDNLPFRNKLISLNSWVNYTVFHVSISDRVIIGSHKWLFYGNVNDGNPIGDYDGTKAFSDEEINAMKDACLKTRKRLDEMGIQMAVIIPTNKERIYAQYMPERYAHTETSRSDRMIERLKKAGVNIINPKDDLLKLRDEYELYYSDDTHWNKLGAYIGTCGILDAWDIQTTDLTELTVVPSARDAGDLAKMLNLGDSVFKNGTDYSIEENYVEDETQLTDSFKYYHNSNAPNHKTVFLIGDSFREAMRSALAAYFSDVYLIHRSDYTHDMLEQVKPDYLIAEYVERYSYNLSAIEQLVFEQ